jgi:hypothetical protein
MFFSDFVSLFIRLFFLTHFFCLPVKMPFSVEMFAFFQPLVDLNKELSE